MSARGRDALGCGLISPQKRAQEVSILGAEKAHGKWCIEGSLSSKQAFANSGASHAPPTARTDGGTIG